MQSSLFAFRGEAQDLPAAINAAWADLEPTQEAAAAARAASFMSRARQSRDRASSAEYAVRISKGHLTNASRGFATVRTLEAGALIILAALAVPKVIYALAWLLCLGTCS